jgi:hypothetical protein
MKGGFILSNVELIDLYEIPEEFPGMYGLEGQALIDAKAAFRGALVYNIGEASYNLPGVYVWDGKKWNASLTVTNANDPLARPLILPISCPDCGDGALFKVKEVYPDLADTEKFVWNIISINPPNAAVTGTVSGDKDSQFFVPYDGTERTYVVTVTAISNNDERDNSDASAPATATGKLEDRHGFWLSGEVFYDIYATQYQTQTLRYGTDNQRDTDDNKLTAGTLERTYTIDRTTSDNTGVLTYTWSVNDPDGILDNFTSSINNNTGTLTIKFKPSVLNDPRIAGNPDAALSVTLTCVAKITGGNCNAEYVLTKLIEVRDRTTGCTLPSTLTTPDYKGTNDTDGHGYITFQCHNLGAEPMRISEQLDYMTNPNLNNKWLRTGGSISNIYTQNSRVYGDLYQWGRQKDNHQLRNASTVQGAVATTSLNNKGQVLEGETAYGNFIRPNVSSPHYEYDWIKTDSYNANYNSTTEMFPARWDGVGANNSSPVSPVKVTDNDPCPNGWRMPTGDEWSSIVNGGANNVVIDDNGKEFTYNKWLPVIPTVSHSIGNNNDTWGSPDTPGGHLIYKIGGDPDAPSLFLPAAGYKYFTGGNVDLSGKQGFYWSSTVMGGGTNMIMLQRQGLTNNYSPALRSHAYSVRCVAEH